MTALEPVSVTVPAPLWRHYSPRVQVGVGAAVANAGMLFGTLMNYIDLGWFAGGVAAVTTTAALTYKRMKVKDSKADTDEVNRILRDYFQSDVMVDHKRHSTLFWQEYQISDGTGGTFDISTEFDETLIEVEDYAGTITVVHTPSDLGLADFDRMLEAMSGNPDIKAVAAQIADERSSRTGILPKIKSKKASNHSLDALEDFHRKKNSSAA